MLIVISDAKNWMEKLEWKDSEGDLIDPELQRLKRLEKL